MSEFLGIARERVFSPGKVDADRLILEAVADDLRRRRHTVTVVSAEDELKRPARTTVVFTMSQGDQALAALREWERAGIRVINSVESILNCHRHRMVAHFARARVSAPETILIDTPSVAWPTWLDRDGGWLKRGDVHATEADDVVRIQGTAAASEAWARFRARGITRAVVQRHLDGVVIKFYGVLDQIVGWYPPANTAFTLTDSQRDELRTTASAAARALGLTVYGGDCVANVTHSLQLIDLNDWPSYAPCRAEGARMIAHHLEAQSESIE